MGDMCENRELGTEDDDLRDKALETLNPRLLEYHDEALASRRIIENLNSRMAELEGQNRSAEFWIATLEKQNRTLVSRIAELEEQNSFSVTRIAELEHQNHISVAQIGEFQARIDELQTCLRKSKMNACEQKEVFDDFLEVVDNCGANLLRRQFYKTKEEKFNAKSAAHDVVFERNMCATQRLYTAFAWCKVADTKPYRSPMRRIAYRRFKAAKAALKAANTELKAAHKIYNVAFRDWRVSRKGEVSDEWETQSVDGEVSDERETQSVEWEDFRKRWTDLTKIIFLRRRIPIRVL